MAHNVETMFSVRKMPWHRLGKILDNPPTSKEAIVEAGLDWKVELKEIAWKHVTSGGNENYTDIPNRRCLVRKTDNKPLALVSGQYEPLQNRDAFKWFDGIVKNGKATYETAGSLQGGKKIWVLAKLNDGMEIVKGDNVRRYLLLANGHDGKTSILVQPTPIRVVCENTLNASLGAGLVNSIWHQGDIKRKMDRVKRALGLAEQEFDKKKETYMEMARFAVNDIKIGTYVHSLIPNANEEATDRVKRSVTVAQERIWDLHETGQGTDIPGVRGTMWGLYNAAIEYGDYDMPKKVRDLGNYQLFGQGAQFKKRAFDKALELMEA
jgi:phage/plasmid-like protein (TIGR03299 family)